MNYEILQKLVNKELLDVSAFEKFFNQIVEMEVPESVISSFIFGLTQKGLDSDELISLALAMNNYTNQLAFDDEDIVGCIGTGVDNSYTFNITTCSALTASACGVKIAKKIKNSLNATNSSASFLKELGIPVFTNFSDIKQQFNSTDICFFDAGLVNNIDVVFNTIRKELNFHTLFDITDAIIHPRAITHLMLGTAYPEMAEAMVAYLNKTGIKRAIVVNAQNPLFDEISICSETTIYELNHGVVEKYEITPDEFGIKRADILSLRGATSKYNASLALDIFSGKIKDSKLDVVAMNAGAMVYLSGKARNYLEGVIKAYTAIDKGLVLEKIQNLRNSL